MVKIPKFILDFNIYYAKDRLEAIRSIPLETLNPAELETVSNYVLYGKDEDNLSCVDRKEIYIKRKYNSYERKDNLSLDELLETPGFTEDNLKPIAPIKCSKEKIDKEKASREIPGFSDLLSQIEAIEKKYSSCNPNSDEAYRLKHLLIDLRRQQYSLVDSYRNPIQIHLNHLKWYEDLSRQILNIPILPRGLMVSNRDYDFMEPRTATDRTSAANPDEEAILLGEKGPFLDFRNAEHLFYLTYYYYELQSQASIYPDSLLNNLLWTYDFYLDKANLSPKARFVVEGKKKRWQNRQIAEALFEEQGFYHKENYISTIWHVSLRKIVRAVELNYDEFLLKNYDKAWKKCIDCGKERLRDSRNFVRQVRSSDGYMGRCKNCERKKRKQYEQKKLRKVLEETRS